MSALAAIREKSRAVRGWTYGIVVAAVVSVLASTLSGQTSWQFLAIWSLASLTFSLAVEVCLRPTSGVGARALTGGESGSLAASIGTYADLVADSSPVEILGGTLKGFTEHGATLKRLHDRHRSGAAIRVLVIDPTGQNLRSLAAERRARGVAVTDAQLASEVAASVRRLRSEFTEAELATTLRFYDAQPHSSVFRFEDRYVLTTYTFGRGGSSPTLSIVRADHDAFTRALDRGFEELWRAARPATNALLDEIDRL